MKTKRSLIKLGPIMLLVASRSATADVFWNITDLGTFGGDQAEASSINDLGQVAVFSDSNIVEGVPGPGNERYVFIWQDGQTTPLNSLQTPGGRISALDAEGEGVLGGVGNINNAGQVVGAFAAEDGNQHAFVWQNGTLTDPGGFDATAIATNTDGQIWVNYIIPPPSEPVPVGFNPYRAFRFQEGGPSTYLGIRISAVNSLGESLSIYDGKYHIWQKDAITGQIVEGLDNISPTALNDVGQVVGIGDYDPEGEVGIPRIFQNGVTTDLGVLDTPVGQYGTHAYAINNPGQVVGFADNGGDYLALLWYHNGNPTDLNTVSDAEQHGLQLGQAFSINNLGQIVGEAYTADGVTHAFLATPSGTLNWIEPGSGVWGDSENWELGFLPNRFLDVVIANDSEAEITVIGPRVDSTVKSLTVGGGGSPAVLDARFRDFTYSNLTVIDNILVSGPSGGDQVLQNIQVTSSSLTLGQDVDSSGVYSLSGFGTLSVTDPEATSSTFLEYIGYAGSGTFNQTDDTTHTITPNGGIGMVLGFSPGANGTYNLSGNGNLTITDPEASSLSVLEYIGYYGSGTFNQTGGTHTITQGGMALGWFQGANGTYNLSGTGELTTGLVLVGAGGTGTFNQSGGVHTSESLYLGDAQLSGDGNQYGFGTYNLTGGILSAETEVIGFSGNGVFDQAAGTHTVTNGLFIGYNDGAEGTYTQSGGNLSVGGSLELGYYNGATGTYNLNGGNLDSQHVYVGEYGDGNFNQTGGSHSVAGNLTIALQNGSTGVYEQSGGTVTVANALEIGSEANAVGSYQLSGSAVLNVKDESVGIFGSGTFNQTGGTHNVTGTLTVNADGSYQLVEGELNAANLLNHGNFTQSGGVSTGNFSNDSTLNYTGGAFNANLTNTGTVNLSGPDARVLGGNVSNRGDFNINGTVARINGEFNNEANGTLTGSEIEIENEGAFNFSGGNYSVSNLTNSGIINLSGAGTRVLSGNITNRGDFNVTDTVAEITDTFNNEEGGNVSGSVIVNNGTFNFSGGTVSADLTNTNEGQVNLVGVGTRVLGGNIGNQGEFNIGDTTAQITGTFDNVAGGTITGSTIQNEGTFNYSGGEYDVINLNNSGTVNLGGTGTRVLSGNITNRGAFNVTDTVAELTGTFNNETGGGVTGGEILNSGTFNYSGGSFNANLTNNGTINLSGGGTRVLGGAISNQGNIVVTDTVAQFSGTFNNFTGGNLSGSEIQNTGTFNYSGGSVNFDQLTNSGTFNLGLGGTPVIDKTITNQGQFNITDAVARFTSTFNNVSGGNISAGLIENSGIFNNSGNNFNANLSNTGTVNLSGTGTRYFNGDVNNQGTFKVTDTNVVFAGNFDNQGGYFSDPSVNTFNNLNVGQDGYLVGGLGDQFIVQGNFTNASTQNNNWDTSQSTLIFASPNGPATHQMALASADLGSALTSFDDNFAWGEVILESGQRLNLVDGNGTPGAALYASRFTLANGVSQVSNISGDYNVYYDPAISANQYLAGSVFNFGSGIGQLIPQGFSFLGTDPEAEGFTPNESSYAQALNSACAQATGALALRCRELRVLTPNQRANAIASSTPTQQMAQTVAPIKFNFARMEAPMLRMAQIRRTHSQASMLSLNGFKMPINFSVAALGLTPRGGGAGDDESFANSFRDEPFGFFIDGKFTVGNQRENPNNFGFDIDSRAVTVGADYRFTDDLVAGVAMEYMNVNTTFNNTAGTMDSDTFMGAVYGSYRLPEDFYVDAIASYGSSEHALTRTFGYPGFSGNANSKPGADQYTFAVTLGKDIAWQEWQVSPYTRFEYLQMHVDSYQENGGGGLAVNVGSQSNTSAISTLGTQISYNLSQSWGVLVPSAWVEWEHQYLDDNERIPMKISAAQAGTGNFIIQTGQPDRDYVNLGGSLSAALPEGKSAFIRYEARLGQTDISNHVVEVGVRIPF